AGTAWGRKGLTRWQRDASGWKGPIFRADTARRRAPGSRRHARRDVRSRPADRTGRLRGRGDSMDQRERSRALRLHMDTRRRSCRGIREIPRCRHRVQKSMRYARPGTPLEWNEEERQGIVTLAPRIHAAHPPQSDQLQALKAPAQRSIALGSHAEKT